MSTKPTRIEEFLPTSKADPVLTELRRLFTSSFYEYYQTVESQLNLSSNTTLTSWLEKTFDDEAEEILSRQCRCFLIFTTPTSTSIAGFLTVKENKNDSHGIYMSQLAIDPILKRNGYGRLLLKHLVDVFPPSTTYICLCRRVNKPALDFYKKNRAQLIDDDRVATTYGYNPVDYLGFQLNTDQLQSL